MAETPLVVKKIGYLTPVNVVNGVPLCPCCQEPCVEREGGWMCALGAAVLDAITPEVNAMLDSILDGAG